MIGWTWGNWLKLRVPLELHTLMYLTKLNFVMLLIRRAGVLGDSEAKVFTHFMFIFFKNWSLLWRWVMMLFSPNMGKMITIQVSQLPKRGIKSNQNELELVGIMYYGFHKEFPTSLLSRLYYHRYYIDLCISIFHILDTHIILIRFRRYHNSFINTRLRPS